MNNGKNLFFSVFVISLLLINVSFAQNFDINEIEEIFYKDILQISAYPGDPFSTNIFIDLIMIFLVPTGVIILFVYSIAGRFYHGHGQLQLLVSVLLYLVIVASGSYGIFIDLAAAYLGLLLIVGGLLFVWSHFTNRPSTSPGGPVSTSPGLATSPYRNMSRGDLNDEEKNKQHEIKSLKTQIARALKSNPQARVENMQQELAAKESELGQIQAALKYGKDIRDFGKHFKGN
jgi:hypothetical protein